MRRKSIAPKRMRSLSLVLLVAGLAAWAPACGPAPLPPPVAAPGVDVSTAPYRLVGGTEPQTLMVDEYLPLSPAPPAGRPAIVLVHGGDYLRRDRGDMAPIANAAAQAGYATFSVDYRLNPPHFPTEVRDVQSAVRWVRTNARRLQVEPGRVAVWGVSGGATLAVDAALASRGPLEQGDRVRAAVGWSGVYDLRDPALPANLTSGLARYLGCRPSSCPARAAEASPATKVDGTDPPVFLANSTSEVVPVSQMTTFARRLERSRVSTGTALVEGTCHGLEYASQATGPTLAFLDRELRGTRGAARRPPQRPACHKTW
jgi:acetyl esterase